MCYDWRIDSISRRPRRVSWGGPGSRGRGALPRAGRPPAVLALPRLLPRGPRLAVGEAAFTHKPPPNALNDTCDHGCHCARSDEYWTPNGSPARG